MSTAERPVTAPAVSTPPIDTTSKTLALRQQQERAHRAALDQRAAAALQARLQAMPKASAELAARVADCQRRRSEDRCPGRCVIRDRLRSAGRRSERPL